MNETTCVICYGTNGGHFASCPKYGGTRKPGEAVPAVCETCKFFCTPRLAIPCRDCVNDGGTLLCWQPRGQAPTEEYTGGSVSYYSVRIGAPTSGGDAYTAECNDIIEALGMNYAEGNAFKAIWRRCAARQGKAKAGYKDGLYDAEKVVFFGERMVAQEKAK